MNGKPSPPKPPPTLRERGSATVVSRPPYHSGMASAPARAEVIAQVADAWIEAKAAVESPLRVGLDGRSTAGKTHLAAELVAELRGRGCEAHQVSIDDFHRKGHKFRSGTWTFESRLAEGLDYETFRAWVLQPLGTGGSRRIRPRMLDSANDEFWPEESIEVGADAIVVSDAGHGFVPAVVELWDYRIWVEVSAETMVERAVRRDMKRGGTADQVRRRYEEFWMPMDAYYIETCDPVSRAHCVIDNNDLGRPVILRI